jgi:precorrin-8X/cobalt-precorrin-8 methylmutase
VIGNAPTALFTVCELVEQGDIDPALVIGVPVGFVGAAESKQKLAEMAIPYITVLGERGGSTIAAAIVNGVAALAGEESGDEESVRS